MAWSPAGGQGTTSPWLALPLPVTPILYQPLNGALFSIQPPGQKSLCLRRRNCGERAPPARDRVGACSDPSRKECHKEGPGWGAAQGGSLDQAGSSSRVGGCPAPGLLALHPWEKPGLGDFGLVLGSSSGASPRQSGRCALKSHSSPSVPDPYCCCVVSLIA